MNFRFQTNRILEKHRDEALSYLRENNVPFQILIDNGVQCPPNSLYLDVARVSLRIENDIVTGWFLG